MKKENKSEIKNALSPLKKWISAFFFLTVLLLVLNKVIIKLLSDLVVGPILSKVERSILNDIIFLAAGISMLIVVVKKRKSYLPDFKIIIYSIALTIGYCYFRFLNTDTWHFTKSIYSLFAYADLLLLTGLISLYYSFRLGYLKSKKQPKVITNFFNDTPIKKIENDLLSYGNYAKNVAKDINQSTFDPAFAIGVTSKWGGGKTSFFYMIKEELNQETMIIDFNPWRSINAKSIVKDFFQVIQNELEPYSSKLATLIKNYGEKIIELKDDGTLAKEGKIPSPFDNRKRAHYYPLIFLNNFARDLAQPLDRSGSVHVDYVPTQIITEYFRFPFSDSLKKDDKINGMIYTSSKNGKKACVLFCDNKESFDLFDFNPSDCISANV